MVVSLLHHILENYGVGMEPLELHADNCAGQNKNNHIMRYLMWHVTTGLHKSGLGLWPAAEEEKEDIDVITGRHRGSIKASSVCNLVQCVCMQYGQVTMSCYDLVTFFRDAYYKPIVGLLSFHSFAVCDEAPSVMVVKMFLCGATERLSLGKGPCLKRATQHPATFQTLNSNPNDRGATTIGQ